MRFLGKILHPKDLTTKEYVDDKVKELDNIKLNTDNVEEYSEDEVNNLWNSIFNASSSINK